MSRKFFVGGNFKTNPTSLKATETLVRNLSVAELDQDTEVVIAPPSLYLFPALDIIKQSNNPQIQVAAQNCFYEASGAYTGEISPAQLSDAGVKYVILGHSERRTIFRESSADVAQKTKAVLSLSPDLRIIFCIGETLSERDAGATVSVVEEQLRAFASPSPATTTTANTIATLTTEHWSRIVIAYEPVWAIGTGKVATAKQAQEVHAAIREFLRKNVNDDVAEQTRIIYGGSVNAKNCAELATQPDIDGFLVGGASLKAEFIDIVNANKKRD